MGRYALRLFLPIALLLLVVACGAGPDTAAHATAATAASSAAAKPVPRTAAPTEVHLNYVLYLAGAQARDPRPLLRDLVGKPDSGIVLVDIEDALTGTQPMLWIDDGPQVIKNMPPFDRETLHYFGQDLSEAQIDAVAGARHAILLRFMHPATTARESLARADRITLALAEALDAYIEDDEARWTYSAASWRALRFADDGSARTDVPAHVALHSYRDGELIRSISVGMQKYALPDVVMEGLSQSSGSSLGWVHNGILQRMVEGQHPESDGGFVFDVRDIADAGLRKTIEEAALPNAGWRGEFRLIPAALEQGDADNALLEVSFESFAGPDESARRESAANQIMGWTDQVKKVRHDDALEQASARAKARLPALREAFRKGLGPREMLQVKAPFHNAEGGGEWMWVEVVAWEGDRIRGILSNEPFHIPELHSGQQVEVDMNEVFDYLHRRSDGSVDGGETNQIIERMQGDVEKRGAE